MKKLGFISMPAFVIMAFVASLIVFAGCTKKEEKEIKIGAILPLTGGAGKYGEDAKAGIELAIEQANAKGGVNGKQIRIIFEDDQSSPQQAVASINKLIEVNKVPMVIGGMTSSSALAIAPIAERNKIVLLSPSASVPALSSAGDYIFRNELSDAYGGIAQAEMTWNRLGIKKVAVIFINNDYGVGAKDSFVKTFEKLGGTVVGSEAFEADSQDFRAQLTRIKQKTPEAIFIIAHKEAIQILKQIKELGIRTKLLSTPVFEDKEILEKTKELAEGVIYVYYGGFDPDSQDVYIRKFVDSFKKKYNREPGYFSALAYDSANIAMQAMEKGDLNSEGIKTSLYQTRDFPGITGRTTFDSNGDVVKPVILKTVRDGLFVLLGN